MLQSLEREFGRFSLDILHKERILKYWYKLKSSQGSLINIIFRYQVENNIRIFLAKLCSKPT